MKVPLNHFFLVLDSATYADIEKSEFLQTEFAAFERRTTVRADRTYTGVYFYGANTYFEFFNASKEVQRAVGDSALAFGVDDPGALPNLQARLTGSMISPITRRLGDTQVPWFRQLTPSAFGPTSRISSWIMEYEPRFLAEWHYDATWDRGIARKQILDRYRATLGKIPAQPCLDDVVGITIGVNRGEAAALTEMCRAFGYRSSKISGETLLEGPDLQLALVSEASAHGIQRVTFRVRRSPGDRSEFHFGPQSILKFNDNGTATWTFHSKARP